MVGIDPEKLEILYVFNNEEDSEDEYDYDAYYETSCFRGLKEKEGWMFCSDVSGSTLAMASLRNTIDFFNLAENIKDTNEIQHSEPFVVNDEDYMDSAAEFLSTNKRYTEPTKSTLIIPDSKLILQMCFLPPLKGISSSSTSGLGHDHLFFIVVYLTTSGDKLRIRVYESYQNKPPVLNTSISLPSNFLNSPPLFLVPVKSSNGAFVLMTSTKCFLVTIPNLCSGTVRFAEITIPNSGRIVAYYQANIVSGVWNDDKNDEDDKENSAIQHIYIGTDKNEIYILTINLSRNEFVRIELFVNLGTEIGNSLIISNAKSGNISTKASERLTDASAVTIFTAGNSVAGGLFYFDRVQDSVNEIDLQSIPDLGPVRDVISIPKKTSNFSSSSKYNLWATAGKDQNSSMIFTIKQGYDSAMVLKGYDATGVKRVYSARSDRPNQDPRQLLVLSFFCATAILEIKPPSDSTQELKIFDFSTDAERSEINLGKETIFFGSIGSWFIWAFSDEVVITNFSADRETLKITSDVAIVDVCISELSKLIAIAYNDGKVKIYRLIEGGRDGSISSNKFNHTTGDDSMELDNSNYIVVAEEWIQRDISTEYGMISKISLCESTAENFKNTVFLYAGTYNLDLFVFQFDTTTFQETSDGSSSLEDDKSIIKIKTHGIVSDICSNHPLLTVILTISGTINFIVDNKLVESRNVALSSMPLRFFGYGTDVLMYSDSCIYRLGKDFNLEELPTPIVMDTNNVQIQAACGFPIASEEKNVGYVAMVLGEELCILEYKSTEMSPYNSVVTSPVGETRSLVRRLLYLNDLDMIVALHDDPVKKKYLRFYYNSKNASVSGTERFDEWKPKSSLALNTNNSKEQFYTFISWEVRLGQHKYKYIVLGSGIVGHSKGYIYLISAKRPKQKSHHVLLQKHFVLSVDKPVYAISQLGDQTLVCGIGENLVVYQLQNSDGDKSYRFIKLNSQNITLPSDIIQISCSANGLIYVSTLLHSVHVFTYSMIVEKGQNPTDIRLEVIAADRVLRASISHTLIDDRFLVLSDKQRRVVVFKPLTFSSHLESLAVFDLPVCIIKLLPVPENSDMFFSYFKQDPVFTNCVLAFGIDGSIYKIRLLVESDLGQNNNKIIELLLRPQGPETLFSEDEKIEEDMMAFSGEFTYPGVIDWRATRALRHKNMMVRDIEKICWF